MKNLIKYVLFLVLLVSSANAQNVKGFITEIKPNAFFIKVADHQLEVTTDTNTRYIEKRKNILRDRYIFKQSDLCLALPVRVSGTLYAENKLRARKVYISRTEFEKTLILNTRVKPLEIAQVKQSEEIKVVADANVKVVAQLSETQTVVDTTRKEVNKLAISFVSLNEIVNGLSLKLADNDVLVEKFNLNLYFPSASAKLKAEHYEALDALTVALGLEKYYIIEVRGYSSTDGNVFANKYLSNERAQAVKEVLLLNYEIPLRNINSFGFGSITDEDSAKARKVQVVVYVRK